MATQKKNQSRKTMFERWLGKKAGDEVESTLEALESVLDNAGVEKKELSGGLELPDQFNEGVFDLMIKSLARDKDIASDMAKAVDALLIKVGGDDPEGLRNKLIATVMQHLAALSDQVEDIEEEVTEEEPVGDEMPLPEDEVVEEEEELMDFAKALIKENSAMHEDVKALAELVPAFLGMAATIKELVPLVKSSGKVDDLQTKVLEMEKKLSSRPRVASKDNGNLFSDKKVLEEIKEGTDGESTFFGHKVKKS